MGRIIKVGLNYWRPLLWSGFILKLLLFLAKYFVGGVNKVVTLCTSGSWLLCGAYGCEGIRVSLVILWD